MVRRDTKDLLRHVRRYTGDKFSAARGYDARKPLSKARLRTLEKYGQLIDELTAQPHRLYKPKRGEKREAFQFTGQSKHPRFDVAIINVPKPDDRYSFSLDRSRPKGSRFVITNRTTREKSWHIPAQAFLDEDELLYEEDRDIDPEFFEAVLQEYAEQGARHSYVIEAGEFHMWGSSGTIPTVAGHLSKLFKQYGAGNFDPFDRNSHWIGNWFRGVQVYSAAEDLAAYAMTRAAAKQEWHDKTGIPAWTKYRLLKSGAIGVFVRGQLVQTVYPRNQDADLYQTTIAKKLGDID